ncbi:hypothetical protein SHELI_v1c01760 [Spiroplasma helicoides]|uniref:Transmembrane protein n=1 Tax=Spiroplasma helicoides TaxID=216938 RepID=A0A1B3SJN4_9MOLU|nr:hypothetical protein [Spiroplasma helicoides]AOG60131.1 hypothetical protein SHELI_v1c01760 [Spiroplasma helicoides]
MQSALKESQVQNKKEENVVASKKDKLAKIKAIKDDIKNKAHEIYLFARNTNRVLLFFVLFLRIVVTFLWVIVPILIALMFYYDPGTRNLLGYILSYILKNTSDGSATVPSVDIRVVEFFSSIITPIIWFVMLFFMLIGFLIPFFSKAQWKKRAFYAFNLFFWSAFMVGLMYLIWYFKEFFPSGQSNNINEFQDPRTIYYNALNDTYSPFKAWGIVYQSIWVTFAIIGIFVSIETTLIRKFKLNFKDMYGRDNSTTSLVNQVVEGKLEFGEVEPKNLRVEIKKLQKQLVVDEKQTIKDNIAEFKEKKKELKMVKKIPKQKK